MMDSVGGSGYSKCMKVSEDSSKRRGLDLDNGERFCSHCGRIIRGQQRSGIRTCPIVNCKKFLHYAQQNWTFQAHVNVGRCSGEFAGYPCGMLIDDVMTYCQLCGAPNMQAIDKKERRERKERLEKEKKMEGELEALKNEKAAMERKMEEMEQTIKNQKKEIHSGKEFEKMLEEDMFDGEAETESSEDKADKSSEKPAKNE